MAQFVQIDKDKFKILGTLTENDIRIMNSLRNRTVYILENTVGLSSDLISKIDSDRVVFSIKGGLDYDTKKKYKAQKYVDRTYVSPEGLKNIIKYFEYNERLIDPSWGDIEKTMFLYNALVVDMEYDEKYETILGDGITERSLNGILYGRLVCAGFALVFKEMMDRIGIKCYYQNQKDVHAFNVIEIDGKRYGIDVTWENTGKKINNGKCSFSKFGQDPEFYNTDGHKLFGLEDAFDFESFEDSEFKKVYDPDEEEFDLTLLSEDEIKKYYSHIASKVESRSPYKHDLSNQPIEIKNKNLPVDRVEYALTQEALKMYPIYIALNFLKNRGALEVSPELLKAFSSRSGYILDVLGGNLNRPSSLNLTSIGLDNYIIEKDGSVEYKKGNENRASRVRGVNFQFKEVTQKELDNLYTHLNQFMNKYLYDYILNTIKELNTLLENYEFKPDEWDDDRAMQSTNIYTKLSMIVNSRDFLIQMGMNEQEIDGIIQRINNKYEELHKPYEKTIDQKENSLGFLEEVFCDIDMVWRTMEYDLQKQLTEEEFASLYSNVDYMIELFEKYITIAGKNKFRFDEYDISKEDLKQLLNKILKNYQNKKTSEETHVL